MPKSLSIKSNWFILTGAICLITMILSFKFLGFDGLYGQDGYAYLHQLEHFEDIYNQDAFYPPIYAFVGWLFRFVFQNSAFSLQLVSTLSWFGTGLLLYKIAKQSFDYRNKFARIAIFVLFVFSPFVLRMSVLVMSDALAVFMAVLTIYFGLFSKQQWAYPLVFMVAALALLTRYALAPLLSPTLIYVVYKVIHKRNLKLGTFTLISLSFAVFLLFFNLFYLTSQNGSTQHSWLQLWDFSNYFKSHFNHQDGDIHYTFPNLIYAFKNMFHPAYALLILPALFFIKLADFKTVESKVLLISFLLYTLFIAGIPFQNDRFLLPAFPLVILLLLPALERLHTRFSKLFALIWILIPLQLLLFLRLIKPVYERHQLEWHLYENLKNYTHKTIYCFDVDIALQGRGLNANWKNLWEEKYVSFAVGGFVLFNESQFSEQWKGKNPMLNWEELKTNYQLKNVLQLDQGWELFEIMSVKSSPQ